MRTDGDLCVFCSFGYDLSCLGSVVGRNTFIFELRLIYYSELEKRSSGLERCYGPLRPPLHEITRWMRISQPSAQPTGGAPSLCPGIPCHLVDFINTVWKAKGCLEGRENTT